MTTVVGSLATSFAALPSPGVAQWARLVTEGEAPTPTATESVKEAVLPPARRAA